MTGQNEDKKFDAHLQELAHTGHTDDIDSLWPELSAHIISGVKDALQNKFETEGKQVHDPLTGASQTVDTKWQELQTVFKDKFSTDPPFTIQRLAEMTLEPNKFYAKQHPEKYLHALEHVINVSSTNSDFARLDLEHEVENEDETGGMEGQTNDRKGIVLTEINWIVDTGTPPPEDLVATAKDEPKESKQRKLSEEQRGE